MNHFYPKRDITVTSSDPHYVSQTKKAFSQVSRKRLPLLLYRKSWSLSKLVTSDQLFFCHSGSFTFSEAVHSTIVYPALQHPPSGLSLAFRPSRSTTAAVIALLHTVCTMLSINDFVHVLSFDFTKAFDTVRHATLMSKMAQLQIPDSVYNCIKDFFQDNCIVQDMLVSVRLSQRWKQASSRDLASNQCRIWSRLPICILWQQETVSWNTQMIHISWSRIPTGHRDSTKSRI